MQGFQLDFAAAIILTETHKIPRRSQSPVTRQTRSPLGSLIFSTDSGQWCARDERSARSTRVPAIGPRERGGRGDSPGRRTEGRGCGDRTGAALDRPPSIQPTGPPWMRSARSTRPAGFGALDRSDPTRILGAFTNSTDHLRTWGRILGDCGFEY